MIVDLTRPLTLRPSRLKTIGLLAISLVFVGIAMLLPGFKEASPVTAWLMVFFFGVGTVVFAVMLLPGAGHLRLQAEGYTVCALFRSKFFPWSAVSGFGGTKIGHRRFVGINFEPETRIGRSIGRLNTRLVGYEGALPDTYCMGPHDLAALMNDALARAKLRS